MIKTSKQLKDLIRNLSKKKAADAQMLMRHYMMERFLERISLSEYKDQFILKGGILVTAMIGLNARSTMDLDTIVKGINVKTDDVEQIVDSIASVPLDDGVSFYIKRIGEIKLETTISRNTTNTSMRDCYDIHSLLQLYGENMNPAVFNQALMANANKLGTEHYLIDMLLIVDEVENSSVIENLWLAYQKKFSYASDITWGTIMESARTSMRLIV